jgi:methionyl-tRNA formyltransferase
VLENNNATIKIIFLGSKPIGFECLSYLIENKNKLNILIEAVFSNDNIRFGAEYSVKKLAENNQIPFFNDISEIANLADVDFMISVQYHQILNKAQIKKATKLAINLHMAPLPEYRGCNQFSFAILNNEKEFGTTLHVMDYKIDHGAIIAESRFGIKENSSVKELYDLTFQKSVELFKNSIESVFKNQIKYIEKSENTPSKLYFRKDIEPFKILDKNWDEEKINKHIRALAMPGFEPPYFLINGEKEYPK